MKKKSQRCRGTAGFLLAVSVVLAWAPSAAGQQRLQGVALANLAPTFVGRGMSPFELEPNHGGTISPIRLLPDREGRRSPQQRSKPESARPAATALGREVLDARPAGSLVRSPSLMAAGHLDFARVSITDSPRAQRLPTFHEEDTPFSSQVRLPMADLWRGRLQLDGFYREISADSVFRGLPQASGVWWATSGSLTLRPAVSYGITLSFRLRRTGATTLFRYLFGLGT